MFHVYLKLLLYRLEMSHFLRNPGSFYWGVVIRKKKNLSVRFAHFYQEVIVFSPFQWTGQIRKSLSKKEGGRRKKKRGRETLLVDILINF